MHIFNLDVLTFVLGTNNAYIQFRCIDLCLGTNNAYIQLM